MLRLLAIDSEGLRGVPKKMNLNKILLVTTPLTLTVGRVL